MTPQKNSPTLTMIAPSGSFEASLIQECEEYLLSMEVQVKRGEDLLGHHPIYANTKKKRLSSLKKALLDKSSDCLWCIRGGAGASGLLPELGRMSPPPKEKSFFGYSDATALLLFFYQKWGWKPFHAPILKEMARKTLHPASQRLLEEILLGKRKTYTLENLLPFNEISQETSELRAPLVGGNLYLLQASLGTPWQVETKGKILFVEDVNEKAYRTLERFEQLSQAGLLGGCEALILGEFNFSEENPEEEKLYDELLKGLASELPFPVLRTKEIGHGEKNTPIQIGNEAILATGAKGTLHLKYEI